MRNALVAAALLFVACGGPLAPCPMLDCANVTTLTVTDGNGQPVNDVSGVVRIGEETFTVGCGSAQAPDAGTTTADGGHLHVEPAQCDGNTIRFYGGNFGRDVSAELRSGGKTFNGVVGVVSESRPVGSGMCSESCPGQIGTVILQ